MKGIPKRTIKIVFGVCSIILACFIAFYYYYTFNVKVVMWDTSEAKIINTYPNINDKTTYLEESYEKSVLESKGNYVKDKRDGYWQWWYPNGNKMDAAYYSNGCYTNKRFHWYDNGKLRAVEYLLENCPENSCCDEITLNYGKDNKLEYVDTKYKNNYTFTVYFYYPNKHLHEIVNFKHLGEVNAPVTEDSLLKNGMYTGYFNNGIIKEKGVYKDNLADGKWIYHDSLEKLIRIDNYSNGKLMSSKTYRM